MKIPVFQIDAFTDQPFSGNPAAVCPLDEWLRDDEMQAIAAEMNLSETAFFRPKENVDGEHGLRWFTPTVEVDLCGHATLASGHVVLLHLNRNLSQVTFHTRSGELGVQFKDGLLELDFPTNPPTKLDDPTEIQAVREALGSAPQEILHANTTMAVFESESEVAALQPDFSAVANLNEPWLLATAPADDAEYDFVSRFFVPTAGINEDPATGSTHTILMPYWAAQFGKDELVGRQISKRGGTMFCRLVSNRVKIAWHIVEVMQGELAL
ncbi:PhzF family phenazine biosynthesis isomerase [Candidatus Lucifugimonas marina]|uniref:PhzF family phenazine biosynthesis protein n=1 Tax=Candidatus Lucifugimonas marina TaxID=3038979 RepID=UPI0027A556EE|nr:PhzF family phenazine biosynthesis isomerase [SAR202 cluster bacterium JH545]